MEPELVLYGLDLYRFSPGHFDFDRGETCCLTDPKPTLAEFPSVDNQDLVAWREEVGDRRFHRPGP